MSRFIFMLTKDDVTVSDAKEVCERIAHLDIGIVGFKDVGLPFDQLRELVEILHRQDREVALEVVSELREDELRSMEAGVELGVDLLLGGVHVAEGLEILGRSAKAPRYCPFPGTVVGHPSRLEGTFDSIVDSARQMAAQEGVWGLDLLAYRFDGDAAALLREVVDAVEIPVIAAGSVDSVERVRAVTEAGAWGFTVGTAAFEGRFTGDERLEVELQAILEACR
jgi:hypothetical protein